MSNFRTRILGLAAMAIAFVGVSYGQAVTCTPDATALQTNPTLRAEGQTEQLAALQVVCTNAAATPTAGTVYLQTSLPITSKQWVTAGVTTNEATMQVTAAIGSGSICAPTNAVAPFTYLAACTVQGTVTGQQASFNLPPGATIPGNGSATLRFVNIRVNASGGGVPQVTESGILSYTVGATSANTPLLGIASASGSGPGFILKTLGNAALSPGSIPTAYTTCGGNAGSVIFNTAPSVSFIVNINELVGGAFLTQPAEQGQYVNGTNIGTAATGDVLNVTINGIASAATINVPTQVSSGGTILTAAGGAPVTTGPLSTVPEATNGEMAFTPASGTVVIPYTVTTAAASGPQTFVVPVRMSFAANAVTATTAGVTISVTYGPAAAALAGPAATIPTFLAATTPSTVTGSGITLCNTTLLFPFVTNQLGFDTGIVLSNTSTDNLGFGGKSAAAPQSGTCTLSFYGAGAPTPATGVADPQGAASATSPVHAFLLSGVASGFQGYMIASCPFQYAHGFAFLAYNLTQNNGAVEGYIAEVLNNSRSTSVTTSGVTVLPNGTIANTSSTSTVPEPVTF